MDARTTHAAEPPSLPATESPAPIHTESSLKLRDVRDGRLVVSYLARADGRTFSAVREVSARLPFECATLFEGGALDPDALTAEERAWVEAESERRIDFEGVAV